MTNTTINITKVQESKFTSIDLDNVTFGTIYTDHMFFCDFKDGEWQQPQIAPYQPLQLDPSARVFHYGQAAFEGMKAYKDENGDAFGYSDLKKTGKELIFQLNSLAMPEVPEEVFMNGLKTLLEMDRTLGCTRKRKFIIYQTVYFCYSSRCFCCSGYRI